MVSSTTQLPKLEISSAKCENEQFFVKINDEETGKNQLNYSFFSYASNIQLLSKSTSSLVSNRKSSILILVIFFIAFMCSMALAIYHHINRPEYSTTSLDERATEPLEGFHVELD